MKNKTIGMVIMLLSIFQIVSFLIILVSQVTPIIFFLIGLYIYKQKDSKK